MRDTWFELPADRRSRLVTLHQDKDGKLTPVHTQDGPTHPDFPARKVTYFSGGGGLSGTTADYARFLQMYLNKGELDGVRLLGRKTIEMMLTNQIGALQPAYGLGFALETPEVDFRSPVSAGTFSWGGAFKTTYWADPKERVVALFYTNIQSAINVENAFRALVNAAIR
jgi:CubicO group peptidase (beta-lactamase class C family)